MLTLAAATALSILLPDWRVSTRPFNPREDVETIATCRTVYERLEPLSARVRDRETRTAGVVQAYRGSRRIAPFVAAAGEEAVNALLGDNNDSAIRVALHLLVEDAQLEDEQSDSHGAAARIFRAFATRCDQQLTAWRAPEDASVPLAVAASGSAEFRLNNKSAAETFADPATAALTRAACDGDAPAVARAIAAGGQPNGAGLRNVSPLVWAVACESIAGVTALLDGGANPSQPAGEAGSAILVAASYRNPELLRLLLRRGGSPDARHEDESALSTAFRLGVFSQDFTNYETLLAAGADINLRFNDNGDTIVDYMTTFRRYEEIYRLLQRGYAGDLVKLGADVTMDERLLDSITPSVHPWIARVKAFLIERGVRFPVTGLYMLERDARGFYIQR